MDFAYNDRQRLIRPRLLDVLWTFLTQPPDMGMPEPDSGPDAHLCGINADALYLDAERLMAVRKLGRAWRGRADAQHTYTNSLGVRTRPDALTEHTR